MDNYSVSIWSTYHSSPTHPLPPNCALWVRAVYEKSFHHVYVCIYLFIASMSTIWNCPCGWIKLNCIYVTSLCISSRMLQILVFQNEYFTSCSNYCATTVWLSLQMFKPALCTWPELAATCTTGILWIFWLKAYITLLPFVNEPIATDAFALYWLYQQTSILSTLNKWTFVFVIFWRGGKWGSINFQALKDRTWSLHSVRATVLYCQIENKKALSQLKKLWKKCF